MVGVMIWLARQRALMPASRAPAAPNRCPVIDLVELTPMRRGGMIGVAGHAGADDRGIDPGSPPAGGPELLEEQDARPFTHHEAIAFSIKRTGGPLRLAIPRRYGPPGGEAGPPQRAYRPLRPSCQ